MKLTTERLKEIIKEEVTTALMEGPDRKEQLRQAIEMWLTDTGLEPENAIALKLGVKKQMRARPKQRHPALQDVLGQWWASGPDFEADVDDVAYEIMGEEKPERAAQPEDTQETPAQQRSREASVRAIDAKMGGRYR